MAAKRPPQAAQVVHAKWGSSKPGMRESTVLAWKALLPDPVASVCRRVQVSPEMMSISFPQSTRRVYGFGNLNLDATRPVRASFLGHGSVVSPICDSQPASISCAQSSRFHFRQSTWPASISRSGLLRSPARMLSRYLQSLSTPTVWPAWSRGQWSPECRALVQGRFVQKSTEAVESGATKGRQSTGSLHLVSRYNETAHPGIDWFV